MNWIAIIALTIAAYALFKVATAIIEQKRRHKVTFIEAAKITAQEKFTPEERQDKKASEEWSPKSLGGQPLYYNEVDHTYGRFVGLVRTDSDRADPRVIHHNFYRVRYLYDVKYFWFIKASKEATTPCVFRPGMDVVSKQPGEEDGVPSEGLVILRRSMDGTRIAKGHQERYKHLLQQEEYHSHMLADMLISIQDRQRLAHMDPGGKEYVDTMVEMLQRTKKIQDAAGGKRDENPFGLGSPYSQEMYGSEDTTPGPGGDEGLWRLG